MSNLSKIIKITIALGIITVFLITQGNRIFSNKNVRAVGDLAVSFETIPLFDESNFIPGDSVTKWVEVKNNGAEDRLVAVRAHNITGSEPNPILPEVLELGITEDTNGSSAEIYRDSLENFFNLDSLALSNLAPGPGTTYYFTVSMDFDVGNEYQGKQVVFDLIFGYECEEPGGDGCVWNIAAQNVGNASGSINTILINITHMFSLVQNNSESVNNNINTDADIGGNSGGSVETGSDSIILKIKNLFNKNFAGW